MEYTSKTAMLLFILTLTSHAGHVLSMWGDWAPNYVSREPEIERSEQKFQGDFPGDDSFKLLLTESDKVLIGGKNRVYNLRLDDLQELSTLEWAANEISQDKCRKHSKTDCTNYIRVLVRKDQDRLFICGTNAYSPACRYYKLTPDQEFVMQRDGEQLGTAVCPFDAVSNSTAIYADGKMYSATRANADGTGPLILQSYHDSKRRTMDGDSTLLNEPQFVSSSEKDDKVYFFFRETAVEYINCGKAVFSRVARVCKKDDGGFHKSWRSTFTSFFKARLNCSMPGEFPFYFDEIQSTSEFGQGNYKPTKDSGDRSDMIYGVFNTPGNSIRGSAVCAFAYSDIERVFQGQFKGQESYRHNWLPVGWEVTPKIHPEKCVNNSRELPSESVRFAKKYPMMDRAVRPKGGMPMLVFTSFNARFTQIAIDWQLLAADKHYYDVIFVGTDDGRVIKAINKGGKEKVESVVIEDIQVLTRGEPVVGLKLISNRSHQVSQKLVVVSRDKVVNIPLHRCERATSCSACVALQDPYCAWNPDLRLCISAETGIQSIATGKHPTCEEFEEVSAELVTEAPEVSMKCLCADIGKKGTFDENVDAGKSGDKLVRGSNWIEEETEGPKLKVAAVQTKPGSGGSESGTAVEIVIVVVIVSIIVSLLLGFAIGYKFQSCRYRDDVFYERGSLSLQRGRNRLSSGDNPHFHTDHHHLAGVGLAPKQMNIVMNRKGNLVETKPVTKSNKVYL